MNALENSALQAPRATTSLRSRPLLWFGVGPLFALAACAQESGQDRFEREVLPILEARCAAASCHGVDEKAAAHGEAIDWNQLFFRLNQAGKIADRQAAYRTAKRAINTAEDPRFSPLLRKPLATELGGVGHYGGENFWSTSDRDYQTIAEWIANEDEGGANPIPLNRLETTFANEVQPVLREATCMNARCHGPKAGAIPYHLDPGIGGLFSIEATRKNYRASLRMASLDGYAESSRLLRKSQLLGPGILHKGLNFDFYAQNPGAGAKAIYDWLCAERSERTGEGCKTSTQSPISGFVYVRGQLPAHDPFDLDAFVPGSDIFLATVSDASLNPGASANLTASLHPSMQVDIRDPAVSPDGTRLAFAMRRSLQEGHRIWTLDLRTREAVQRTFDGECAAAGTITHDRDPTFGPENAIWFVSTCAGIVADQGDKLDAEIYSIAMDGGVRRRWTYTPHIERKPVFFTIGEEAGGEIGFSVLRDALPDQARVHIFRFPPSQESEYHQHFGVTPIENFIFDMRELPDGRYVSVAGNLPARHEAGALAIVDRNFGPEINARSASQTPALADYRPPMNLLHLPGLVRDPAVLPDGRILIAHDPNLAPEGNEERHLITRIEVLTLAESPDGTGPIIADRQTLVIEDGEALYDPEPISLRAPIEIDAPPLPPAADAYAIFSHQGVDIVDALLRSLSPSGKKELRSDAVYMRLVEHLALPTTARKVIDHEASGVVSTTSGLGVHGPSRVLAELPLAADGSVHVKVPVGVSFRVQLLDAQRMAVGAMHNRWYYALPGQTLVQGLSLSKGREAYATRCAACHGDLDGADTPPSLALPDAISGASLTLSRYEGQNPRRPIDPPPLTPEMGIDIDFVADIQPILDRHCIACHADENKAPGIDLRGLPTANFSRSYETLSKSGSGSGHGRAYVDADEGRARSSYLIELLRGAELEAPREVPALGRVHPGGPQAETGMSEEEFLQIVRWIELGATFRGSTKP